MASFINFNAGEDCVCCFEPFEGSNKVDYQNHVDDSWRQSPYCLDCITHLQNTNWDKYINDVTKADCKASLRRALEDGPPIYIRDKAFETEGINNTGEIFQLRCEGKVISAKLKGSLEGDERNKWWNEWKNIMETMNTADNKDLAIATESANESAVESAVESAAEVANESATATATESSTVTVSETVIESDSESFNESDNIKVV